MFKKTSVQVRERSGDEFQIELTKPTCLLHTLLILQIALLVSYLGNVNV